MISVFTPSHDSRFLDNALMTVQGQSYQDWEWIILLNHGAAWTPPPDKRIRIAYSNSEGVGRLKWETCKEAKGDILVELDHDDILHAGALYLVKEAFDQSDAGMVYSDTYQINEDSTPNQDKFDLAHGWEYVGDREGYSTCQSMEPFPHNVSYVWYAPNHVRAFRRDVYDKVGGFDPDLDIVDDQDLVCRMYQEALVVHIHQGLYGQRIHPGNTQRDPETNAKIQRETVALYDRHIGPNCLAWARRNNLLALDLGAAHNKPEGYLGVDAHPGEGVDFAGDIFDILHHMYDGSVGVIRAADFLEHVTDKVRLFNEFYRVLAHGGMVLSLTPSTDGRGAHQDPTHVSYWNENSFWYFTDASFAQYVPEITCRFQVSRLVTYHPSDWHVEHDIPYVCANLIAIKDGPRQGGLLHW
jgi:O-antigen biosynthesis protein